MLTYDICSLINTKWYKLHYYERLYGPQEYMFSSRAQDLCTNVYVPVADESVRFNTHLNLLKYATQNDCIKLIEYIYFNETDIPNKNCISFYIWSGTLASVRWGYKNKISWFDYNIIINKHIYVGNLDVLKFMYEHFSGLRFNALYCIEKGYKEIIKWLISINYITLDEVYNAIMKYNVELLDWYNSELI